MVMDDFPFRDLMRRRRQTLLATLNLVTCVAVTVFFTLFGENIGAGLSLAANARLTQGLSVILSRFTVIVALLNSAAGVLVASFLISTMTSERIRDVGLMKAIGGLTDMVFTYFTVELSLITLAGCTVGISIGVLLNSFSVWLLNTVGFQIQLKPVNPWTLILIFLLFASLSLILGIRQVVKGIRVKPVEALSHISQLGTDYRSGMWIPSKFGLVGRIALRTLLRRRSQTGEVVACLSVILTLVTLSVCGGITAKETTKRYVERAIGNDVILVAEAEIAEQYKNLLTRFFEPRQTNTFDYLAQKHLIPRSVISNLSLTEGIVKIDARLILETTIYEYPKVAPDPESPERYITIGDHRTCRVVAVGVNPDQVVNEWLLLGRKLEGTDLNAAVIGDSAGLKTFDDPLKQNFKMLDTDFSVVGVCVDPINNGEVVYVSFSMLSSLGGEQGYNLLLLQIDPGNRRETLTRVKAEIERANLVMLDLNEVLSHQIEFLDYVWSIVLVFSLFSLLNAAFCLLGYMALAFISQRRDFGVMRALGAKPCTIVKIVFLEALLLVSASGLMAIPLGLTFTFLFLIPEAAISQAALLPAMGLIFLVLGVISVSSMYPAVSIAREPLNKTISFE